MGYDHVLEVAEQKELLRIARTTIKEYLISGRIPPGAPHNQRLTAAAGVFVSLHEGEMLRGCIGTTQETTPLYKVVQEMAIAAASRDPRYRAVMVDELPGLSIEVSVLGARTAMRSSSDIEIGVHGLQVTSTEGGRPQRGLLLPKVGLEQRWNAETLLAKTCEKAGLAPHYWRGREGQVELFKAQVFDERSLKSGPFAATSP